MSNEILQLESVSRTYGEGAMSVAALRSVSLTINAGEFVAVMGPSGSGKSSLLTLAGGLDKATSGEIFVEGTPLGGLSINELASIGADTKLRKAISGSQTLMTAMLGTVLGVFAGAVPTVVVLSLQRGFPIVIPWLQIAALMILVPLFGAAAAWLLTRGKLPMTRRQTLV